MLELVVDEEKDLYVIISADLNVSKLRAKYGSYES